MSSREKQMASSTLTVANTSANPRALPPRATHKRDHGWPPVCLPAEQLENTFYFACKRYLDLILATLLLILLLPLFVVIALLIKLDSPGPVFFIQERVGARHRSLANQTIWVIRNFAMYKFRSMVADADPSPHEAYIRDFVEGRAPSLLAPDGKFKLTNDPRVTRLGRFLRKFSLDELPQLLNVLKADMSLVGPRPVPPYEVACYRNRDRRRLAALPGITGLWQVRGRCLVSFEEMVRMDVDYIRNASLLLDLKILCLTIPAVLSKRGAE
jgi:lipopolysaccharide/colanic/teichoic acid biosynthesis glycosyltransferase